MPVLFLFLILRIMKKIMSAKEITRTVIVYTFGAEVENFQSGQTIRRELRAHKRITKRMIEIFLIVELIFFIFPPYYKILQD